MGMQLKDALDSVYFTADMHLSHKNILRYCKRPFATIDEHDDALIRNANQVVGDGVCYHIGDFYLGTGVGPYLGRLTGEWHFLKGDHDSWMRRFRFENYDNFILEQPLLALEFDDGGEYPVSIVLCHWAMRVWSRSHYGAYHLYGHSHGTLPGLGKSMDVGVDANEFMPISLRSVLEKLS